jgi:ribonuclease VapC
VVVDASALLALINAEPGAHAVDAVLGQAVISAVNLSEVIAKLGDIGIADDDAWHAAGDLVPTVVAFDTELARIAARLRRATRGHGLSSGDRACLALAEKLRLPVLTADQAWRKLSIGLDIRFVR